INENGLPLCRYGLAFTALQFLDRISCELLVGIYWNKRKLHTKVERRGGDRISSHNSTEGLSQHYHWNEKWPN
ncbi:hypothetical protein ILYODFUR_038937, partial [Ilyodon furcidens]